MRSRIMDLVADYPDKKSALMAIMGSAIALLGDLSGQSFSVSKAADILGGSDEELDGDGREF